MGGERAGGVSVKLHRLTDQGDRPVGYLHWCPGCKAPHGIYVEQPSPSTGARWTFDGNLELPSFGPSILCFTTDGDWGPDGKWVEGPNRRTLCHYFIIGGQIQFCGDSPHQLSGQTVPLPDYPERYLQPADADSPRAARKGRRAPPVARPAPASPARHEAAPPPFRYRRD